VHQHRLRELAGRTFNHLVRGLLVRGIKDTQCGFKLFTREAARGIFARGLTDGFSFDVEALFLAQRGGMVIAEVPVLWRNDASTRVSLAAGLRAFSDVVAIGLAAARGRYDASDDLRECG
jgi:dolichyl-phosphate beta-glucosyltransferase